MCCSWVHCQPPPSPLDCHVIEMHCIECPLFTSLSLCQMLKSNESKFYGVFSAYIRTKISSPFRWVSERYTKQGEQANKTKMLQNKHCVSQFVEKCQKQAATACVNTASKEKQRKMGENSICNIIAVVKLIELKDIPYCKLQKKLLILKIDIQIRNTSW